MNFNQHCNLCDNHKKDFQNGMVCGLTDLKPMFDKRCSKILLDKNIRDKLGLILIKI